MSQFTNWALEVIQRGEFAVGSNETYLSIMPLVSLRITTLSCPPLGRTKIDYTKTYCQYCKSACQPQFWAGINNLKHFCIYELCNHIFLQNVLPSTFHRENGVSREIPSDTSNRKPVSNVRQPLALPNQLEPPSITHSSLRLLPSRSKAILYYMLYYSSPVLLFAWTGNVKHRLLLSLCWHKQYGIIQQESLLGQEKVEQSWSVRLFLSETEGLIYSETFIITFTTFPQNTPQCGSST